MTENLEIDVQKFWKNLSMGISGISAVVLSSLLFHSEHQLYLAIITASAGLSTLWYFAPLEVAGELQ